MPGISGMQLVQSLSPAPMVIFTTAYSHYAVESYNVNAVDYLLKPIIFERFLTAVDKAAKAGLLKNKTDGDNEKTIVYLKSGPQTHPVNLNGILYLEKDGNYMTVHLKDRRILIRENMSGVFDLVPAADFIRVHKSYVVAIKHITMIEAQQLRVSGKIIPVGSSYRDAVRAKLGLK
jgi:DNA-binding LytR/AlgR family response regulator